MKEEIIQELVNSGVLKTPHIVEAFRAIDRKDFVLSEHRAEAYFNTPLSIGHGQTISQPYTVAFMLELLKPLSGNNILDVGSGSGWQTALLAYIVGSKGKVFGIELIPELKKFGERNVSKYNFVSKKIVKFLNANAQNGLPSEAPFDRIIAGASAREVPTAWKEQLRVGGRIVLSINESIWLLVKNKDGTFSEQKFPGFVFVPFVTSD